jgi:hypothetical protein
VPILLIVEKPVDRKKTTNPSARQCHDPYASLQRKSVEISPNKEIVTWCKQKGVCREVRKDRIAFAARTSRPFVPYTYS